MTLRSEAYAPTARTFRGTKAAFLAKTAVCKTSVPDKESNEVRESRHENLEKDY